MRIWLIGLTLGVILLCEKSVTAQNKPFISTLSVGYFGDMLMYPGFTIEVGKQLRFRSRNVNKIGQVQTAFSIKPAIRYILHPRVNSLKNAMLLGNYYLQMGKRLRFDIDLGYGWLGHFNKGTTYYMEDDQIMMRGLTSRNYHCVEAGIGLGYMLKKDWSIYVKQNTMLQLGYGSLPALPRLIGQIGITKHLYARAS